MAGRTPSAANGMIDSQSWWKQCCRGALASGAVVVGPLAALPCSSSWCLARASPRCSRWFRCS
eukprot:3868703-Alexandrium_andersonii.AAC.1